MSALRRLGDALLSVAAAAGVVGLALFVAVQAGAVQSLVVTSGSMRPAYDVGDVILAREVRATALDVGDVATLDDGTGRLVTHRVVAVEPGAGPGVVTVGMQGDANASADAAPYVVDSALVPLLRVPAVGPVVAAVQRPTVYVPGLVAVLALVLVALLPSGRPDAGDGTAEGAAVVGDLQRLDGRRPS
ncbi:signal peptidase I [Cellulomonas sp. S1-8]|uniref:signal peptidase I n=1 Tax=Cellulomonas sp. S1-8 TaxID=2904790 RepID=UPI0022447558|nr:signal peptidase I [Cellulomonas sp. S1-8]UZN02972.1 signal peptidase I [Cellulomonas sp. S1-8]